MFQIPAKKIAFCGENDCSQTSAAMLSDTDMAELLEHENIYCADEWVEKQKRIAPNWITTSWP